MLRAILLAAVVAGALAGLVVTGLQALRLVPLILQAETYEQSEAIPADGGVGHGHAAPGDAAAGDAGWAPESALQRTLATTFANLLTAIGFALLLAAALALTGGRAGTRACSGGSAAMPPSCSHPRSACRRACRACRRRRSRPASSGGSPPWSRPRRGCSC